MATWHLRAVPVMDPSGFAQPIEALRLLLPADWRLEGGVAWVPNLQNPAMCVQTQFRARAPDGLTGITAFPHASWSWNEDPLAQQMAEQSAAMMGQTTPAWPPMRAAELVERVLLPQHRPTARVQGATPDPETARARAMAAQTEWGAFAQVQVDLATVHIAFTVGGHPVEEDITAAVADVITQGISASAAMMGMIGVPAACHALSATDLFALRCPAGQRPAHEALFRTILGSITVNPAWAQAARQAITGMAQTHQQGVMQRQQIMHASQQGISDLIVNGWEQRQAGVDRSNARFSQALRGVETWVDPGTGGAVELRAHFAQAWRNDLGEYVVSDDALFDPNRSLTGGWTELRRDG